MKELVQFYKTFLSDRQLDQFDGRILCRYQISNKEFLILENLLKRVALVNLGNLKTIIAPLFVLYTSESWRRNFSGAQWTWITVLKNLDQGDLRNIRYKYVKKGFRFLKRELRETENGTRYLGSIAIESGIPIQILENEQNNLTGVIKDIFKSLENAISNESPIDLVNNIALNRLPITYHNDRFFLLLYDFSKALQSLSIKYMLEDQNNPMAYLDQNHADWKNELPIVINQQNKNFFNTLLSDVAEITRTINNKLNVNYFLKNNNGTNSLHFNVTLKKGVYLPEVLGITQEDFKQLPNRFILVKNQGDDIIHIGYFDKVGNGEKFRVENLAINDLTVSFNQDTFYYLSDFNDDIKIELNLNTVDFKNNDTPLIFINDKNQWKLKAVGSSKLIESTYKVLCINDSVISQGIELPFYAPNYKLFKLNKEVSITNNDGSLFKINFSQTLDCNRFELLRVNSGLKFAENENNSIFIGFPHLLKYNSNGRYLGRFQTDVLQVFINNNWMPISGATNICGRVKVRLCLNEITEFSSWINVLPKKFEFNIQQNKREITLNNLPLYSSITVENKNFEINTNTLTYSKNIPGYTKLILQSKNSDKPVIVKLPLPVQGSFFTKQGELLDNKSSLSINQLKGLRLCIFNLSNRSANKTVQIKLQKSGITSSKRYLIEAYGSKEISLLNLRDELVRLFSIENSPDSIITLESDNQTLFVRKYNSAPYFCDDNKGYKFPLSNTKVNVFRLDQDFSVEKIKVLFINQETQLLEKEPNEGLYFVFSPDESENYFRPIVLIKNVESFNFDDNTHFNDWSFSEISKINDVNDSKRGYQLRSRAIKQRLKTIAYDYSNEEWKNNIIPLSEYFKNSYLTLSSLDIFKHATCSDTVLASLFFYLDNDFIHQFSNEFSVVWRKIAISKWKKSFDAYKNYYSEILGNKTALIDTIINQKIELLEAFDLKNVKSILNNENIAINGAILNAWLPDELNSLRIRQANNTWYNEINDKVDIWFKQCNLKKKIDQSLLDRLNSGNRFEYSIKYFPIVLAYASVHNINLDNLEDPILKYEVLKIRAFDPEWYNTIYDWFQSYFYAQQQIQTQQQV
jgi:hypothetical protein